MKKDVEKRLKQINIEDFIWTIYIGIIILSFYSNKVEKKYFIYNNIKDKKKYQEINIIIFSILLVVYLYFLKSSFDDIKSLNKSDTIKKKKLVYLSFLASCFITISGFIFLYIALSDKDLDIELAFN